jgi:hypothetical protein
MPASPNVAPPGWYTLFVLDTAGTPSVARCCTAGAPDAPTLVARDAHGNASRRNLRIRGAATG